MLLQENQRQILDLVSLCVHHSAFASSFASVCSLFSHPAVSAADAERLGVLTDLYLARLVRTQDPTPTYEQYAQSLSILSSTKTV